MERRSRLRMAEQRAAISAKGVAARRGETTESVNVSDPVEKPKRDTRAEVAREVNIPERKLRDYPHPTVGAQLRKENIEAPL